MKSFIISKNDSDQRLDKFVTKTVPNLPKALMYKYIRTKRIKVNKKKSEISARLRTGDLVEMYINDEFFVKSETKYDFSSASDKIDIIYEDDNIILLDKKAGLLCHPDDKEYIDTLISRVKKYLYNKGEYDPDEENSFTPALVNRIDRNTGGIVIAAKNAASLKILNAQMKERNLKKTYLCVVHGVMERKSGLLEGWLVKDESKNRVRIYNKYTDGAKEIKTKYRVIENDTRNNLSLLEVDLLTGRTHQIRAHFASIGHPLLGDGKYGKNELNKKLGYKRQFLYSYKLTFDLDENAGELSYLKGKTFTADNVWFVKEFKERNL